MGFPIQNDARDGGNSAILLLLLSYFISEFSMEIRRYPPLRIEKDLGIGNSGFWKTSAFNIS